MIGHGAPQRILKPASVRELDRMLDDHPTVPLFAGGTLAVPDWRHGGAPEVALHLGGVAGLRHLGPDGCGALTTLAELMADDRAPAAVRQAATSIGGPAVRTMATVGGNVVAARPGCIAVALLAAGAIAAESSSVRQGVNENFSLDDLFMAQGFLLRSVRWHTDRYTAFASNRHRGGSMFKAEVNGTACELPADGRPAVVHQDTRVTTVEGLARQRDPLLHEFVEHGAAQCGFCTAGMIVAARAHLTERAGCPVPEDGVRRALAGNVCRCSGYTAVVAAVRSAAGEVPGA